jgi:ribose 5-phosphate isomerase B
MLEKKGVPFEDHGTHSADSVDYPDFAVPVARDVAEGRADLGILICWTGIGMSIVANKIRGVRAALCRDPEHARLARRHNNANVLALSGREVASPLAREIVSAFLETPFSGEPRHSRRVDKIHRLTEP